MLDIFIQLLKDYEANIRVLNMQVSQNLNAINVTTCPKNDDQLTKKLVYLIIERNAWILAYNKILMALEENKISYSQFYTPLVNPFLMLPTDGDGNMTYKDN